MNAFGAYDLHRASQTFFQAKFKGISSRFSVLKHLHQLFRVLAHIGIPFEFLGNTILVNKWLAGRKIDGNFVLLI